MIQDFIFGEIYKNSSIISSSSLITTFTSPSSIALFVSSLLISVFSIFILSNENPAIISFLSVITVALAPKSSEIILQTSLSAVKSLNSLK